MSAGFGLPSRRVSAFSWSAETRTLLVTERVEEPGEEAFDANYTYTDMDCVSASGQEIVLAHRPNAERDPGDPGRGFSGGCVVVGCNGTNTLDNGQPHPRRPAR